MEKEKKEILKLLELLNEYENRDDDQQIEWRIGEGDKGEKGKVRGIVNEVYMGWVSELVVCSAYYGFIKWLVENDKIDRDILEGKRPCYYLDNLLDMHGDKVFSRCERLLMLLAIQEQPIRFLCEILK